MSTLKMYAEIIEMQQARIAFLIAEIAALKLDKARLAVFAFAWVNERGEELPDDAQSLAASVEQHLFQYLPDDLDPLTFIFAKLREAIAQAVQIEHQQQSNAHAGCGTIRSDSTTRAQP